MNVEHPKKSEKTSVFDLLNLRYQWEEAVREYKMDASRKEGTIENIKWYIENGALKNRFRNGFKESHDLALEISEKF
jgi:hypothetical protein